MCKENGRCAVCCSWRAYMLRQESLHCVLLMARIQAETHSLHSHDRVCTACAAVVRDCLAWKMRGCGTSESTGSETRQRSPTSERRGSDPDESINRASATIDDAVAFRQNTFLDVPASRLTRAHRDTRGRVEKHPLSQAAPGRGRWEPCAVRE